MTQARMSRPPHPGNKHTGLRNLNTQAIVGATVAVIEVEGLGKTYRDGTRALQDVSFRVEKGEIFGVLGPNGAGKTTMMKVLGTLHRATAGSARVLGIDVHRDPHQVRRRIGFAMQEVGMDELATAQEMLMLHARLYGVARADAQARAEALLETFGLTEHADRRVSRFSGGMQRRLDLAVSLIHDPEVLFLDEPSTGLDPKSRSDLWDILRRLRRDEGLTILMSTHYMDEADALCDRIAIINGGTIAAIDTPERLKRSVGADTITVSVPGGVEVRQRQHLTSTFGPGNVIFVGDDVQVRVTDGERALMPALRVFESAGVSVAGTKVKSPTLDDAYLKYTGHRLEAES